MGTVVPIPAIKYCLSLATRHESGLVESALRVVCFSRCVEVWCLKINCSSWGSVLLRADDHLMPPCYWVLCRDGFE